MNYQKIWTQIWDDDKFRGLSKDGKLLFLNMLINKNGNVIGFFVLRRGYAMEDIKLNQTELDKALHEIIKQGMVIYDETNALFLIKNYLKYTPIYADGQLKSATKVLKKLPKSELLNDFKELLERPEIQNEGKNADLIPIISEVIEVAHGVPARQVGIPGDQGQKVSPSPLKTEQPKMNIEGLVETWNHLCVPILPQVMSIPKTRETTIRARLKERPDLEEWKGIFTKIVTSPTLCGETQSGWRATFDWVMKPMNLQKILEGNYDRGNNANKPKTGMDALAEFVKTQKEKEAIPIEPAFDRNQLGDEDGACDLQPGDGVNSDNF